MKVTRIAVLAFEKEESKYPLDLLLQTFSSAIRFSFNRLVEGADYGELIKRVASLFRLNKRYAEDAVLQAQTIIRSQKKLLPAYLEHTEVKIQKSEQKLSDYLTGKKRPKKVSLDICIAGVRARLEKLRTKAKDLRQHIQNDTVPSIIFGGKKNFYARMKRKLSKEEWKEIRSNTLYSRGDASKQGNLNTRIVYDDVAESFVLEIANPLQLEEGKRKAPRIVVPIHIPHKYFNEIVNVVMPHVKGMSPKGKPIESYPLYSVEIKKKKGVYYVHITYEAETTGSLLKWNEKISSQYVAGIDINVDRIAVSVLTGQGNLLESKTFYCHEMEYVSSNRRSNIAGEMAKTIIDYVLGWNVGAIVLEDLKMGQTHDTNKKVNRVTHAFASRKIQSALISRGLKHGFKIKTVNPAYTSVIGRCKYSKQYGLSVHEAASFVIGRRGLDFEEEVPKKLLQILQTTVKSVLLGKVGSMEESEKKTKQGMQSMKRYITFVKNIEGFKQNHYWKIWNVVHKTLRLTNQGFQFKEV